MIDFVLVSKELPNELKITCFLLLVEQYEKLLYILWKRGVLYFRKNKAYRKEHNNNVVVKSQSDNKIM